MSFALHFLLLFKHPLFFHEIVFLNTLFLKVVRGGAFFLTSVALGGRRALVVILVVLLGRRDVVVVDNVPNVVPLIIPAPLLVRLLAPSPVITLRVTLPRDCNPLFFRDFLKVLRPELMSDSTSLPICLAAGRMYLFKKGKILGPTLASTLARNPSPWDTLFRLLKILMSWSP